MAETFPSTSGTHSQPDAAGFYSTRWSLVLAAGETQGDAARLALESLCRIYWQPIYAYIRRRGYDSATAEDLTQGALMLLIERQDLGRADPTRGRFRAYLLTCVKHFLLNEQTRELALKRGGGQRLVPLDVSATESRLSVEPAGELDPEKSFERQWALTLLDRVRQVLQGEYAATGRQALFQRLEGLLTGAGLDEKYASVASDLKISEGAVKVAAHRLRQRFGEVLRQEIAQTVASPEDITSEIQALFNALRN